ncbi:MAG: hypothetical protein ABR968_13545 [Bacteroidales bacterium]|jgi:hypothetical protein
MKIKIFLVILFFNSFYVFSQEDSKTKPKSSKIFQAMGYTVLADFVSSPVKVYPNSIYDDNTSTYIPTNSFIKTDAINLGSCMYRFRYNFYEPSQESAFSFSLTPSFGFGLVVPEKSGDAAGFCTFNMPLLINYEIAAGSTYKSTKEHGFFFGAGIEYYKSPLIFVGWTGEKPISSFILPVASAGFRFWTKTNRMAEINLKFGKGPKVKLPDVYDKTSLPGTLSAYEFRVAYVRFLKY